MWTLCLSSHCSWWKFNPYGWRSPESGSADYQPWLLEHGQLEPFEKPSCVSPSSCWSRKAFLPCSNIFDEYLELSQIPSIILKGTGYLYEQWHWLKSLFPAQYNGSLIWVRDDTELKMLNLKENPTHAIYSIASWAWHKTRREYTLAISKTETIFYLLLSAFKPDFSFTCSVCWNTV